MLSIMKFLSRTQKFFSQFFEKNHSLYSVGLIKVACIKRGNNMSKSEFRYNKKRKHYSYLFKDIGQLRKNLLLSSKQTRKHHGKRKKNVKLYRHPNKKNSK